MGIYLAESPIPGRFFPDSYSKQTRDSAAATGRYPNIVPAVKRKRVDSTTALGSPTTNGSVNTRGDSKEGIGTTFDRHDDPIPSTSDFLKLDK